MPIDENLIFEKLQELEVAEHASDTKTSRIRKLKQRLQQIQTKEIEDPNDRNRKIKVDPIDEGTNKTMTESRRNELYDTAIVDADRILAS